MHRFFQRIIGTHLYLNDTPSSHTFENTSKQCKLTIEHFVYASHNLALFNSCHVLHDLTSDHSPLVVEICSNVFCCSQQQKNKHSLYNWRKLSQKEISGSYSVTLCNKLHELNPPTSPANSLAIEEYLLNICTAMHNSCKETIPPKLLQKYKKYGWNSSVNAAHRQSKGAWKWWKLSDNPNNPTSPARESYLKAKLEFRKALRAWKRDQDFSLLCQSGSPDKLFQLLWNTSGTQPNLTNHTFIENQV